jgi:tetratricopeptide (TPR) repeat protein
VDSALSVVRSAIAVLPFGGGLEIRARGRLLEAQLLVMKGDYGAAGAAAAEAATLGDGAGLLQLVATARLAEAWISNWSGEGSMEGNGYIFERAIEACRKAGDRPGEIEARHVWSNFQFATGRLSEFVEINERLIEQSREIGDAAHEAAITERLTNVETMRGNSHLAERHLAVADALATKYGFRNVINRLILDRGLQHMVEGDLTAAEDRFRQYLIASREAGAIQLQVGALRFLGYILMPAARFAEAAQLLDQALELSETSGERSATSKPQSRLSSVDFPRSARATSPESLKFTPASG